VAFSTDSRSATRAVALSVFSVLAFATFASVLRSPFQPLVGDVPGGPFVWLAKSIHADALPGNLLVAVGLGVIALSIVSFLLLLREAWRGNVSLRLVLALVVAYHVVVLMLPLLFSRDVYSYAFYGRIVGIYHGNPYVQTPLNYASDPSVRWLWNLVGPRWVDTPAVYGPLFSTIAGGIARGFGSPSGQVDAYRVLAVVSSLATVAVIVWTTRAIWPSRSAFAAVAFGANPVILFHSVASAHNDVLVALSIAVALAFVVRGRELPAIAALTLGASIKASAVLPLILFLLWCVVRRPPGLRLRAFLTHGGIAAGLAALISAPYMQLHDPSLGMLELAGHEGWLAPSYFLRQVPDAITFHLLGNFLGALVRTAFLVGLVLGFAAIAREVYKRADAMSPRGHGAAWGWSLLLLMLLGPVLLPWYVVWAMPLAWLLPRAARTALIGTGVALALSQWCTEVALYDGAFRLSQQVAHWVFAPIVIVLLLWLLIDLRKRVLAGLPFESEEDEDLPAAVGRF
jgi:alpha-1,6-mannosyltransferase